MANIYFPFLNPLRFVEKDKTNLPQYNTKHFDDFLFNEQQYAWEQQVIYHQKFSTVDTIKLQFQASIDPIQVSLINNDTNKVEITFAASWTLRSQNDPTLFVYQVSMDLSSIPEGCYYVQIDCGNPIVKTLVSENIEVISDISNTLLFEYSNTKYFGNIIFETGIVLNLRVEGIVNKMTPKSKDIIYEDETLNETILSGRAYRLFKLGIGGTFGVPPWMIDKLNWILNCNNVSIDGKYFTKSEGASFDTKEEENYPMAGYSIDIRESLRRDSSIFSTTVNTNKKLLLIGNIDSKGFGDLIAAGSNTIRIVDIE